MTNEDPNAPVGPNPQRRTPRQGIGGSPVGSTLSIVLAVVAVVAGFLILRNITDDGGGGSADGGGIGSEVTIPDTVNNTIADTTTSTTQPPLVTEGATVIVANASGVPGSAGRMTDELAGVGFTMGTATNATSSGLEASIVYYDPGITAAQAVADSVALSMGGLAVETVPTPVPVEGATLNGAGVLVMLGTNQADKTIEEMSPTAAETVTAPEVSGDTTATDAATTGTSTG
ncbi:MAG: LytR C-terminal domain-containing protein [Ilumatobacteraceae bacterium]